MGGEWDGRTVGAGSEVGEGGGAGGHGGEDSRYYGSVTKAEIKGKVITIVRRNDL